MRNMDRLLSWGLCSCLALLLACDPPRPSDSGPASPPVVSSPPDTPSSDTRPESPAPIPPPTVVAIAHDRTLRALRDAIPPGWRLLTQHDRIVIERIEPVWVLSENRVNAPASTESEADRIARIQKHGKRVQSRIVFRAEAGWTQDKLNAVRDHNDSVNERRAGLADRHRIRHLIDASAHRKNNDPRIGASAEELPRVEAYEAERRAMQGELRPVPAYLTELYGLFPLGHEGWSDAHTIVHPHGVAEECYRLDDAVRALLAKEGTDTSR